MRPGVNVHLCASMALRAYGSHDWVADNIEGLAELHHGCLYLACRGTADNDKDKLDWSLAWDIVRNIRLLPRYHRHTGWVPGGFLDAGEAVAEQSAKLLDQMDKPAVLTGHSLGGAAAFVAAEILLAEGYPVLGAVGFGVPHTGRMKRLNKQGLGKAYRYGSDIVTTVPPIWRSAVSNTVKLKREGDGGPLRDHKMLKYREAIFQRR